MGNPPAIPVRKKEIFGWAMYDFANSSYTTVIISVVYAAFFVNYIVPDGTVKDSYWSLAIILSTLTAMILAPLLGALCDITGFKKRYLLGTTLICAASTAGLFFVGPGDFTLAILLLLVSNASFMISESLCASFLTELATPSTMAMISGIGWGIGYMGGLVSLLIVKAIVRNEPENTTAYIQDHQTAMAAIGVFFLIAAMPTFLLVKERSFPVKGASQLRLSELLTMSWQKIKSSFQEGFTGSVLFKFLTAFTVYMAGIEVVIKFVGIYATAEVGYTTGELAVVFLILQFSAMAGALGFGYLEKYLGARDTVFATLIMWFGCVISIFLLQNIADLLGVTAKQVFFVIALFAGAGIGSTQSSSRAVVGLLTPENDSAQTFGLWSFFAKLAIMLGMTFGFVSDLIGSRRHALLLVLLFFVIGGLLLKRIKLHPAGKFT